MGSPSTAKFAQDFKYSWPLCRNTFTWLDRLKICSFFLKPSNRWTQDKYVREYERKVADYVGCKYAVFVSSGSAANTLIAQQIKEKLIKSHQWPKKKHVVVGAVTWQTNVSVWVQLGFEPIFLDVNLSDYSIDLEKLEPLLASRGEEIACVFPTSVLGLTPNVPKMKSICKAHGVELRLDNCENFFGSYSYYEDGYTHTKNISEEVTSSTSCYIAHQISTGQEGGFIFTNSEDEYAYFILARAHGLLRNLKAYEDVIGPVHIKMRHNCLVNKEFDFVHISSNHRSSDISAYMGLLDLKRATKNKHHREDVSYLFYDNLDYGKFVNNHRHVSQLAPDLNAIDVHFCLPLITHTEKQIQQVKSCLDQHGVEYRPFIGGNLLRQTPYRKYDSYTHFPNAEILHKNAVYIGLHTQVKPEQAKMLALALNQSVAD